jgi:putative spermidine/putrescine transport system ATP-binding protein
MGSEIMAFLTLANITKTFKDTTAVADFNLDVTRGEFVSFLGPSGCGKTTTLRMVAGFETPTTGSIVINGDDVTYRPPNRRKVGMVFQSYALFPNLTVAGNIGFGLKVAKRPAAEIEKTVVEMLDIIHLPQLGARYPYQLSGGQQQRVALARALAIHPQVLLLDEPLSALDAKIRVELRTEIRRIQQQLGITTVYVTHDQEEALSLSDRIVVMNAGRVDQIGPPAEIYNYPRSSFVASFIGQLNLLPVVVQDAAGGVVALGRAGGQIIRTEQLIQAARGSAVTLAIRPQELKIEPLRNTGEVDAAGVNHLSAVLESVMFLGAIVRVKTALAGLDDGPLLSVDLFNDRQLVLPKAGEPVKLIFPPHACWISETAGV